MFLIKAILKPDLHLAVHPYDHEGFPACAYVQWSLEAVVARMLSFLTSAPSMAWQATWKQDTEE